MSGTKEGFDGPDKGSLGGSMEMDEICSTGRLERDGGVADQKSLDGGVGRVVGIVGKGVLYWEPVIHWQGDDMVGDTLVEDSSSSGELSSGSVSGEESELWARRFARLICRMVGVGYSEHDSWSS